MKQEQSPALWQERSGLELSQASLSAVQAVVQERLAAILPTTPTRSELELGREVAYRLAVQVGAQGLAAHAAKVIVAMHEDTHQRHLTTIESLNNAVRSIQNPHDQVEVAYATARQKAMLERHLLGILEAGAFAVAKELDRPLYTEAPRERLFRRGGRQ